jgi:hypothetical protein
LKQLRTDKFIFIPGISLFPTQENRSYRSIFFVIIILGIALRSWHFLYNRSLWVDEIYLSSSLLHMNIYELLTEPLDHQQKAPPGYLVLARLIFQFLGSSEYALRSLSFATGIGSLFLFRHIAVRLLPTGAALLALVIYCLGPHFIFHSVEAKQYMVELFCSMLAIYLFLQYAQKESTRDYVKWGLSGMLLPFFSFSSVFVLMAMLAAKGLQMLMDKNWNRLFTLAIPAFLWCSTGLLMHIFNESKNYDNDWLLYWFEIRDGFLPLPPTSLADLLRLAETSNWLVHYPLGLAYDFMEVNTDNFPPLLKMAALPVILMVAGAFGLYKNQKLFFLVFASLMLILFTVSALRIYPFYERLQFFLAPFLLIVLAQGFHMSLQNLLTRRFRFLILFLLLLGPVTRNVIDILQPKHFGGYKNATCRQSLQYINDRIQQGDGVYVYWVNQYAYNFYRQALPLKFNAFVGNDHRWSSKDLDDYLLKLREEIKSLQEKHDRLWVIYEKTYFVDIGDFDGKPEWYFHQHQVKPRMQAMILDLGVEMDSFETDQFKVLLIGKR